MNNKVKKYTIEWENVSAMALMSKEYKELNSIIRGEMT